MITIKHPIEFPNTYPLDRIGPLKDLLFFDIETTGFSGETSQLYLIGCTYFDGFGWKLIQWFADTRQAEKELLDAFFEFLKRFKILIHFNGDRFDIPFILDAEKMKLAPKDLIVLHPLPRINEIAVEVDDDPRAKYFVQAQNSVYVRMALILMLLNIEPGLFEEETVC